jgi:hypothetical protein
VSHEFDVRMPESLEMHVGRVRPFSLSEVLRSRRLAGWKLPWPRGWARLAASFVRMRPERPVRPRPTDPLLAPLDRIREEVIYRRSRRYQEV